MKIIVANWKMNHGFEETDKWIDGFYATYKNTLEQDQLVEVILCPPAALLDYIDSELIEDGFHFMEYVASKEGREVDDFSSEEISKYIYQSRVIKLGAQDCGMGEAGQFTGDISPKLLAELNCQYAILGHSERRKHYNETDEMVAKKVAAAVGAGLIPIICIGETSQIRASGQHLEFVKKQLLNSLPKNAARIVTIAYEPIWAIGTGDNANISQIEEMVNFIRQIYQQEFADLIEEFYILYGGSTNSANSSEILKIQGLDGLLVGKASLDIEEFSKIIEAAAQKSS